MNLKKHIRRDQKTGKKKKLKIINSLSNSRKKKSIYGKETKKGTTSRLNNYLSREEAIKKLRIDADDFRKACILKGIYPRNPPKKAKKNVLYYHVKDVKFLSHESILCKMKESKSIAKKLIKTKQKSGITSARQKYKQSVPFSLQHLVKERFPRFIDALREIDDALCLVHLYAALPHVGEGINERMKACSQLVREWQLWIAKSSSLTKVFAAKKGIYFQVEVTGMPVTWIMPHQYAVGDYEGVDFQIMDTFVDFYIVLLKFVMFKLYADAGLRYPPELDKNLENDDMGLSILKVTSFNDNETCNVQKNEADATSSLSEKKMKDRVTSLNVKMSDILSKEKKADQNMDSNNYDEDPGELSDESFGELTTMNNDSVINFDVAKLDLLRRKRLFKGLTFYLGRETPRSWMEFVIVSCGGKVTWDSPGSNSNLTDESITHYIFDRPIDSVNDLLLEHRECVQPQWIFDSINVRMKLPVSRYRQGESLPPHLSPFVDDVKEGYMPAYKEEIASLDEKRIQLSSLVKNSDKNVEIHPINDANENSLEQSDDSDDMEADSANMKGKEEEKKTEKRVKKCNPAIHTDGRSKKVAAQLESRELSKTMMTEKSKKLYNRMVKKDGKKRQQIERLKSKRRNIEKKYSMPVESRN